MTSFAINVTFMCGYRGHLKKKLNPLSKSHVFNQKLKTFLNSFFHVMNIQTNKQTLLYRFEANTPKTSVCAPLVKLYKFLLCFALGPLLSEILKFFPGGFWTD